MKKTTLVLLAFASIFLFSCKKDGKYTPPKMPWEEVITEEWHSFSSLEMVANGTIGGGTLVKVDSEINEGVMSKGDWYVYISLNNQVFYIPEWKDDESQFTDLSDIQEGFIVQRLVGSKDGYEFGVRQHHPDDLNTNSYKVRAVYIPNGELSGEEIDFTDYSQVKDYFDLD